MFKKTTRARLKRNMKNRLLPSSYCEPALASKLGSTGKLTGVPTCPAFRPIHAQRVNSERQHAIISYDAQLHSFTGAVIRTVEVVAFVSKYQTSPAGSWKCTRDHQSKEDQNQEHTDVLMSLDLHLIQNIMGHAPRQCYIIIYFDPCVED